MKRLVLVGAVALAAGLVTILVACASTQVDEAPFVDGADPDHGDSGQADSGRGDADADVDDDDFVVPDASVVCEVSPCMTKIIAGKDGFCAISNDGRARCWGDNRSGVLGRAPEQSTLATPSIVKGVTGISDLGMGETNTCARLADRSVYCWGEWGLVNAGVVPPDGGEPSYGSEPTRQDAVPPAESLAVGRGFACVILSDGSLTCWGENYYRELGRGATQLSVETPAKATLLTRSVASVIAGNRRTFVITPDGNTLSWGANTQSVDENYLLGRETSEDPNERPSLVPRLSRVRGIATGTYHSCAVAGRFVRCWGANANGQLGRGTFENASHVPAESLLADVTDAEDADASTSASEHDVPVQVVTGDAHSCAVLGSGRVYCWGNAGEYRLLGPRIKGSIVCATPTRVDGFGGPVVGLAASSTATCALLRSGAVECWGANDLGQLGMGSTDEAPHPSPKPVSFPQ